MRKLTIEHANKLLRNHNEVTIKCLQTLEAEHLLCLWIEAISDNRENSKKVPFRTRQKALNALQQIEELLLPGKEVAA